MPTGKYTIPIQDKEERYKICEIVKAAEITASTVYGRMKALGFKRDGQGLTYEQLMQVLTYKTKRIKASPQKIDKLKLKLKNDGFKIKEEKVMK